MTYKAPDIVPGWWKPQPDEKPTGSFHENIDSFGFQWADCKKYGEDYGKCELKAKSSDGKVHTYGYHYYSDDSWQIIIPPGVFAYSSFDINNVKGYVKNGKYFAFDRDSDSPGDIYAKIVSADAVVLGED